MSVDYQPGDRVEYRPLTGADWIAAEFVHRCTEGPRTGSLAVRVKRRGRMNLLVVGIDPVNVRPRP